MQRSRPAHSRGMWGGRGIRERRDSESGCHGNGFHREDSITEKTGQDRRKEEASSSELEEERDTNKDPKGFCRFAGQLARLLYAPRKPTPLWGVKRSFWLSYNSGDGLRASSLKWKPWQREQLWVFLKVARKPRGRGDCRQLSYMSKWCPHVSGKLKASYENSLCFSLLIRKMGMLVLPTAWSCGRNEELVCL